MIAEGGRRNRREGPVRKLAITILGAALLAGCVTASDVVPAGKDTYMVTGGGTGGISYGKTAIAALKKANAYCASLHKLVMIRNTQTQSAFNGENSSLVFSCLSADDPEYRTPNLRKDNGVTTIENR